MTPEKRQYGGATQNSRFVGCDRCCHWSPNEVARTTVARDMMTKVHESPKI